MTEPVRLIDEPRDVSVGFGDKVSIACKAAGYPEPTVTWSSLDMKPVVSVNGNLIFDSADFSTRGKYKCHASNGVGDAVNKVIEIHVNGTNKYYTP
jgi:hypothetical protein